MRYQAYGYLPRRGACRPLTDTELYCMVTAQRYEALAGRVTTAGRRTRDLLIASSTPNSLHHHGTRAMIDMWSRPPVIAGVLLPQRSARHVVVLFRRLSNDRYTLPVFSGRPRTLVSFWTTVLQVENNYDVINNSARRSRWPVFTGVQK